MGCTKKWFVSAIAILFTLVSWGNARGSTTTAAPGESSSGAASLVLFDFDRIFRSGDENRRPGGFVLDQSSVAQAKPLSPLTRSLLVPGWGQIDRGHTLKGAIFMGIALGSAGLAYYDNRQANEAYDEYRDAVAEPDIVRFRQDTEAFDRRRNQALLLLAVNHLVNVLDIIFLE